MAGGIREEVGDDDDIEEVSEINVTPFIDVMLVLLIIFMVAAPMSTVNAPVDLPRLNSQSQPTSDKPLYVTLQLDQTVLVQDDVVSVDALAPALLAATEGDLEKRVLLRADRSIAYGDVISLMNRLRDAGFTRLALVGLEGTSGAP
mgnify:FL=1